MEYRVRTYVQGLLRILCPPEVFLVAVLFMSGIIAIIHWDRPDPISLLLPRWVSIGWDAALIVGGLVTLTGIFTLNWLIVRLGYTLLGPAAAAYALALIPHATVLPIRINVAVLLSFALSALWRCLQITSTARGLK